MTSLYACLTHACRQIRWMDDNPCFNLTKLKEGSVRECVLTQDEGICFSQHSSLLYHLAACAGASNLQLKTALGHKTSQMLERYAQSIHHLSEKAEEQFGVSDHI